MGLNDNCDSAIPSNLENDLVLLLFDNVRVSFFITLLSQKPAPPLPHLVMCCSSLVRTVLSCGV